MEPTRLSEYERTRYYDGVQGHLLARTSSYEFPDFSGMSSEWPYNRGPDYSKVFNTIGKYPLVAIWSDRLAGSIQDALSNVEWQAFYPIRIGVSPKRYILTDYPKLPERELVLMVDVVPDTTNWERAIPIALACRSLLRNQGIYDIEVEMREIHREPYGSNTAEFENALESKFWENQAPSWLSDTFNQKLLPILPLLGHTIQPSHATTAGTMGLYIKLDGRPSEVYGLTCRHVVAPSNGDNQQHLVNRGYKGLLKQIRDSLHSSEQTLDPLMRMAEYKRMKYDMDPRLGT
ncbi:hypothetical protein B0T24DRAFT_415348 [Lasiosphaeria ovina]|uniref:Uncharacterized protein n=1 Tax=Lasiosphaeria ovina TaxID=92902 RepID=A0AAE0JXH9_9PEZI|nr:hypothetical protein B0T24DRAFT_415348 [Lasiosphaeria ovina]